jgi:TonB family protein
MSGLGQSPADDVYRVGPDVTKPILRHKEEPVYSPAALNAHIQGTVLLQVVIDQQGVPQDITVLSPLGFGLDEKAIEAVAVWRFKPGMKDGNPVKIRATVEVSFRVLGVAFDEKMEERRTRFNSIMTRLSRTKDGKPSEKDVSDLEDLANHKFPAANYVLGVWQVKGDFGSKDLSAGLAHIQKAADLNYGPALFYIGRAKMQGDLLPKDEARGMSLIRDASLLGSNEAQFLLGQIYEKGIGVEADIGRAERSFRLCAASGTPECQYRLGKLLLNSPKRKEHEWLQAIAWLELAQGHNLASAGEIADTEALKLTPQQAQAVARLREQLEHKH